MAAAARRAAAAESDPLAELARLIGQTDPFADAPGQPRSRRSRRNDAARSPAMRRRRRSRPDEDERAAEPAG